MKAKDCELTATCPACKGIMDSKPEHGVFPNEDDDMWYLCRNKKCALQIPYHPKNDRHHYCPNCFATMEETENNIYNAEVVHCPECDKDRTKKESNHA